VTSLGFTRVYRKAPTIAAGAVDDDDDDEVEVKS